MPVAHTKVSPEIRQPSRPMRDSGAAHSRLINATTAFLISWLLTACTRAPTPPQLLGELEWDRIAIPCETSEPIVKIAVVEGAQVQAGQLLLELDPRRAQAQYDAAQADAQRLQAAMDELLHGTRVEVIEAARAELAHADSQLVNAKQERLRAAEVRKKGFNSQADMDRADTILRTSQADVNAKRAKLAELLHGTRPEDIAQAQAALSSAQAKLQAFAVQLEHLSLHAPRAGRVDALPYKLGDQPPAGASLVSLLVGDAPYARVYVPEPQRAALKLGTHFRIHVDGVEKPFTATLRSIRAEPTFTPYYALHDEDASRLSYRAELALEGEAAKELPAGLPLQADLATDERH